MNEGRETNDPTPRFSDGPIDDLVIRDLELLRDERGWLAELFRSDELSPRLHPAMAYISETLPGVVRGPHEHVEQTDYFAFLGPGDFELYFWDNRVNSPTQGHRMKLPAGASQRRIVIVPPGVVHAYQNVSDVPGWVFNAPNRLYAGWGKQRPVDELRHEDDAESPYQLWG